MTDEALTASQDRTGDEIDIQQLLEFLPHRFPFLLVDKVIGIDGWSCIGVKNVTANEPQFLGHFPERPIFPGVLMIEGMAQTAGALVLHNTKLKKPYIVYFMTIDKARFRKPVVPGDRIHYEVSMLKQRRQIWKFGCVATVDGAKVAEAEVAAMIQPQGEVG